MSWRVRPLRMDSRTRWKGNIGIGLLLCQYFQVNRSSDSPPCSPSLWCDPDFPNQLVELAAATSLGVFADQCTGDEASRLKQVAAIRHAHVHSGTNRPDERKRISTHWT